VRLAPSTKEKIDFFLRHPLTLSLTGMLLGSLLIPCMSVERAFVHHTLIGGSTSL